MNFKPRFSLIIFLILVLVFQRNTLTKLCAQHGVAIGSHIQIETADQNNQFEALLAGLLRSDVSKVFGQPLKSGPGGKIILRLAGEKIKGIKSSHLKKTDQIIKGKWEVFAYDVYKKNTIVITGSDPRGLAYGVFNLSEKLGVSPWYDWADVPVKKRSSPFIIHDTISQPPSVQYRGIFINDEDWGLQPWAAKTYETELKDIGPKTYAKVFELLLRLKANLIWPAMHPSTKAFYYYPESKEIAKKYNIVVGTSHAEPLMRNNVDEWIDSTMGEYNYLTNAAGIQQYWQSRMEEIQAYENLYSIGMRGKHDSGMEGVKSVSEAVNLTNQIILDQRDLLSKTLKKSPNQIPQVLTLYKEVLDLYKEGLKVPEDVVLIWPDDNYGYIKSLSDEMERVRSGGSGVYYHASYWGRPHDYLWIGTTDPALMRFEMQKAYETGSRKVWVVNVGDIKPMEYPMQLFLDMAYDIKPFLGKESVKKHLENWTITNLGDVGLADLLWENYRLNFIRKPEFMGWSKVEPITPSQPSGFSLSEIEERFKAFKSLENKVYLSLPKDESFNDAYYELLAYPVLAAAMMNKKFLNLDLFYAIDPKDRKDQKLHFDQAIQAHSTIQSLTRRYNEYLLSGKWNHIMSMAPRNLPVFGHPDSLVSNQVKTNLTKPQPEVMIAAGQYTRLSQAENAIWEVLEEPGFSGSVLVSKPFTLEKPLSESGPVAAYEFTLSKKGNYRLEVLALPLHPVNLHAGQKVAVRLDDNAWELLDFETFGRSEEWKENVLSNQTTRNVSFPGLSQGNHTLQVRMIDAGFLFDSFRFYEEKTSDGN